MTVANPQDILFVLKVPPPFGGGEIEHQYIYDALKDRYRFIRFSRPSHNKARQGKVKLANVLFGLRMITQVIFRCLRQRPNVVFIWLPKDFPAFLRNAALVSLLNRMHIRVIGDLHGMGFGFLSSNRWQRMYEKHINRYAAIRTLSDSIAQKLRSSGFQHHIRVIDNGIDTPAALRVKRGPLREPVKLLYLGAISEAKGFMRVLHSLVQLKNGGMRFLLQVVGEWTDSAFRDHAQRVIREHGLQSELTFSGILIDDAKWRAIEQSDLLLHFTEWDGQPLTIIEAMAAGVPAMATRVGAIPEMIKHGTNGFLIDRPEQAIELMHHLVQQPADYEKISKRARQTYERRFSYQTYIENIEQLVGDMNRATSHPVSKNR